MNRTKFGPISFIPGDNQGRYPYCNSIFIDDKVKVIIDPGAGEKPLGAINEQTKIEMVFITHMHFDHFVFTHILDQAEIIINETEQECFPHRAEIIRRYGMMEYYGEGYAEEWLEKTEQLYSQEGFAFSVPYRKEWKLSTARKDGLYKVGDRYDFGECEMILLPTPGHTAGFNCPYFPKQGLVYAGDYDLTAFGPMYSAYDSDVDEFIASSKILTELDADYYITSHETGVVSKKEFKTRMVEFLGAIDRRTETILTALDRPKELMELAGQGFIFPQKVLVDPWIRVGEMMLVRNHLKKLLRDGLVVMNGEKYARA